MQAHGTQKRASGDPYFAHPLEVAAILTELKLDDATIVAAVLHDTIEDTEATLEEIDTQLRAGDRRAGRRPDQDQAASTSSRSAPRRPRTSASSCWRSPTTCACCWSSSPTGCTTCARSHSCRPDKRAAHRRGDPRHLRAARRPHGHAGDARRARGPRLPASQPGGLRDDQPAPARCLGRRASALVDEIERELTKKLAAQGIKAEVKGREKRPYSIWRKMERKSVALRAALRHLRLPDRRRHGRRCYRALGVVHTTWPMVPGRFKDYISTPKQNDYRSIHTTVVGPGRQRVELQIRTATMDEVAEYGIAAHALYKDGVHRHVAARQREPGLSMAAAHHRAPRRGRQPGGVPRAHQARAVPRPGLLLHAEGPADRAAARRDADRLRLCGPHRRRQHRRRLQDQRPHGAAADRARRTATRSRSSAPTARRRRRPGNRSSSPARRAPRSAAPRARRCGEQYAGLGRQILERAFERAGKTLIATTS